MGLIKNYSFYCLLFLLLLFLSQAQSERFYLHSFDRYTSHCESLYLQSNAVSVVSLDRISKALRASGHRLMPAILAANFRRLVPYCGRDILFFVDSRNRLTIYGNATSAITLFVPRDEAVRVEDWIRLDSQIVASKVGPGDFDTRFSSPWFCEVEGLQVYDRMKYIYNRYYRFNELVPVENPNASHGNGSVYIGGARVSKWNIYNDGHVIVHGTDDFFNYKYIGCPTFDHYLTQPYADCRINTEQFEVI